VIVAHDVLVGELYHRVPSIAVVLDGRPKEFEDPFRKSPGCRGRVLDAIETLMASSIIAISNYETLLQFAHLVCDTQHKFRFYLALRADPNRLWRMSNFGEIS